MKERPILFNTEMVKAILEGRKTQTRRVIKLPSEKKYGFRNQRWTAIKPHSGGGWMATDGDPDKMVEFSKEGFKCPYGKPDDRLWVRETWTDSETDGAIYKVDEEINNFIYTDLDDEPRKWSPSIFMPRWASRITLEVTDIRVERVQDITVEDCFLEGIVPPRRKGMFAEDETYEITMEMFEKLWDSINKKRGYGMDANPWIWVIEFKKID